MSRYAAGIRWAEKKNFMNTSIYAFFDYTCYVVLQYRQFFGKLEEGMEQAAAATIVYIGRIHNMCVLLLQAYEAHRLVLSVCSPYFRAIFTRASGVTVRGGGAQARHFFVCKKMDLRYLSGDFFLVRRSSSSLRTLSRSSSSACCSTCTTGR